LEILIEQMAQSLWRRQRIIRAEKAEIALDLAEAPRKFDKQKHDKEMAAIFGGYGSLPINTEMESRGDNKDPLLKMPKATTEERKRLYMESQLRPTVDPLLLRYESTLERQFYRALIILTKIKEAGSRGVGFVSQKQSIETKAADSNRC